MTYLAEYEAMKAWHTGSANGPNPDRGALELVRFGDMSPRLEGQPLVRGIIERNQISLTAGETGAGKTFLNLDRDLHIAAGWDWFRHPVSQGAVVYVAAEAGRSIINRVAAFKQHHDLDDADLPFAAITSSIDLCHPETGDLAQLVETITAAGLGALALVEIDTVSRVLAGGDENSAAEMGMLVRSFDQLRDKLDCHVFAIHHLGKDVSRGPRGHSLLKAAVDTVIELSRDAATRVSRATIVKQRDGATEGEITFRLIPVELGFDAAGHKVTSCVVEPAEAAPAKGKAPRLSPAQARAMDVLAEAINTTGQVPPASNHIPANIRCVKEELWRQYCYEGAISAGDQNAKRMAFKRAAEALLASHQVGKWGDLVWLV
jgi:AAA domain